MRSAAQKQNVKKEEINVGINRIIYVRLKYRKLDGHGRARREAARRLKSECKIIIIIIIIILLFI